MEGMRKAILLLANLWLLWLGLMILVVQFNKYSWAEPPMLDCDTDAEAAFMLMAWLVCLTTAAIAAWFAGFYRSIGRNLPTVTLLLAIAVSSGTATKYFALVDYSKGIAVQCADDGDSRQ